MDATTLIVSALMSGLTSGLTDVTQTAIQGTFEAFRKKLTERTKDNPDAADAVRKLEDDPASTARRSLLVEELEKINIAKDKELINLAKLVVEQISKQGKPGKYNIQVENSRGIVIGDHSQVEQKFGNRRSKKG